MDPIHSPIHTLLHVPGVAFIAIPRHALNLLGLLQRNPKLCLFAVAFVGLTDLENLSHLRCGASRSLGVSVSHTQIQATISGPRRHRDLVQVTGEVGFCRRSPVVARSSQASRARFPKAPVSQHSPRTCRLSPRKPPVLPAGRTEGLDLGSPCPPALLLLSTAPPPVSTQHAKLSFHLS